MRNFALMEFIKPSLAQSIAVKKMDIQPDPTFAKQIPFYT